MVKKFAYTGYLGPIPQNIVDEILKELFTLTHLDLSYIRTPNLVDLLKIIITKLEGSPLVFLDLRNSRCDNEVIQSLLTYVETHNSICLQYVMLEYTQNVDKDLGKQLKKKLAHHHKVQAFNLKVELVLRLGHKCPGCLLSRCGLDIVEYIFKIYFSDSFKYKNN